MDDAPKKNKGGRPPTGCPKWDPEAGAWFVRVPLGGNRREFVRMNGVGELEVERAHKRAKHIVELRRAGAAVEDLDAGEKVSEWTERWLADRELRSIKTVGHDRGRLKRHILPVIGTRPMASIGREDIERVVEDLDRKIRLEDEDDAHIEWKTASNVWTIITTMFKDAVNAKRRDLRALKANPADGVRGPERGEAKSKQYLYPSELLKLVSCEDVPLRFRVGYAIAVYTYARAGEIVALTWDDVDLEHRTIHITKAHNHASGEVEGTKSKVSRKIAIEPSLLPLLERLHAARGKSKNVVELADHEDRAIFLREHLETAKVTRPQLFTNDARHKWMTFHDLRATGITWMAVRGDNPLTIKQRAGHATFSTTEGYVREAENLREGFGEPFPPLPDDFGSAPEVSVRVSGFGPGDPLFSSVFRGATGDRNPAQTSPNDGDAAADLSAKQALAATLDVAKPAAVSATLATSENTVDDDLERRIVEAELAGRRTVADVLARQLECRRAARAAGNVVDLAVKRRGGA